MFGASLGWEEEASAAGGEGVEVGCEAETGGEAGEGREALSGT